MHPTHPLTPPAIPAGLPLLSVRVTAGFPSPAEDYQSDSLDLTARCIRNPVATFFAEVDQSTSMTDYGVFPGDTLIVDRSITAKSGHMVVALWNGGLTVKKLEIRRGKVRLLSGNPENPPIDVPEEDQLEIWGVVTWSLRKHL